MKKFTLPAILLIALSANATADNSQKMDHSQHMKMMKSADNTDVPTEAGQAGFAAIAEIVRLLSENPDTDWSKVNIDALREHLLDMDRLVTGAEVQEQAIENGMRFNVTGKSAVLRAIQNMVPAHTAELSKIPEYTATTETIDNGVAMIITGKDDKTALKIKGLGFFGLMATGSHHQPHHFSMATGQGHGMKH